MEWETSPYMRSLNKHRGSRGLQAARLSWGRLALWWFSRKMARKEMGRTTSCVVFEPFRRYSTSSAGQVRKLVCWAQSGCPRRSEWLPEEGDWRLTRGRGFRERGERKREKTWKKFEFWLVRVFLSDFIFLAIFTKWGLVLAFFSQVFRY